jgi:hypothetical protein
LASSEYLKLAAEREKEEKVRSQRRDEDSDDRDPLFASIAKSAHKMFKAMGIWIEDFIVCMITVNTDQINWIS